MTHEYPVELVGHRLRHVAVQIKGRDHWNRTNLLTNSLNEIASGSHPLRRLLHVNRDKDHLMATLGDGFKQFLLHLIVSSLPL